MFIDPSMGGQIYNPWRMHSPILQRYGEMNPGMGNEKQKTITGANETAYRFFGPGGSSQSQAGGMQGTYRVFRNFF